jgi:hypothetical protein
MPSGLHDRPYTRRLLKTLPWLKVHQDGDYETTVIFNVGDFTRMAEVMRPKKKRPAPTWMRRVPAACLGRE